MTRLLELGDSVLVVVDAQPGFLSGGDDVVARIAWLVRVAAALDVPIVVTEEEPERNGATHARLAERLPPAAAGDYEITGYVDTFPTLAPGQAAFGFAVQEPRPAGVPARLRLTWYDPPATLAAGNGFAWRGVKQARRHPAAGSYTLFVKADAQGSSSYGAEGQWCTYGNACLLSSAGGGAGAPTGAGRLAEQDETHKATGVALSF